MANKILVAADATPIVWAADVGYGGSGGAQTADITLATLAVGAARFGDSVDLDRAVVANRYPREIAVTLRMAFPTATTPEGSIDLYWASALTLAGPFPDGIGPDEGAYTGTTGSTIAESLSQLHFLGPLMVTQDGEEQGAQQATFRATLPTQFGVPVIFNNADEALDTATLLSITFTPREYEVQ